MKRRGIRLLLLVALGTLTTATGAAEAMAQVLVVPANVPSSVASGPSFLASPPRLIDSGVSWVAGDTAGHHWVMRVDPGQVPRTLTSLPAPPNITALVDPGETFDLELSDQATALSRIAQSCSDFEACKYQMYELVEQDVLMAVPGGMPMSVVGCAPTLAARACDPHQCAQSQVGVAVSGPAVAFLNSPCDYATSPVTVRQLDGKTESFAGGLPIAMAGRYLADAQQVTTSSGGHATVVVVYDWTAGAEVARVTANGLGAIAIQPDGTFAVLYAGSGYPPSDFIAAPSRLAWASLAQPYLHDLGKTSSPILRLASDRLLTDEVTVENPEIGKLVERALNGTIIQRGTVSASADQIDFDGSRFAYPLRPCELSDIVVTDSLASTPTPSALNARCPAPAFASSAITLGHGVLTTRLVCSKDPYLGCEGTLRLTTAARGRRRARAPKRSFLGDASYRLDPDEAASVSVTLGRNARRFVARHHTLAVIARATEGDPFAEEPVPVKNPAATQATLMLIRQS